MFYRLIGATVLALSAAATAQAQNWEGFYGGVQIGAAQGDAGGYLISNPAVNFPIEPDGAIGGVFFGHNWRAAPQVIVGVELDAFVADVSGDGPVNTAPTQIVGEALDNSVALRARLGYDAGRFLPYIAVGAAKGSIEIETKGTLTPNKRTDRRNGVTGAIGVDYMFGANTFLRFELSRTRYEDKSYSDLPGIAPINIDEFTMDSALLGVAMKF